MNGYGIHSSATSLLQSERLYLLPCNPIVTTKKCCRLSACVNGPLMNFETGKLSHASRFASYIDVRANHFPLCVEIDIYLDFFSQVYKEKTQDHDSLFRLEQVACNDFRVYKPFSVLCETSAIGAYFLNVLLSAEISR